jgi:putative endonuclease
VLPPGVPEVRMANGKPWFLYLIECVDGSIYTGITVDVAARYAAHLNGKGARYTRSHPPLRLLGSQTYADRSAASRAEYQVKRLSPAEKRALAGRLAQNNSASPHSIS